VGRIEDVPKRAVSEVLASTSQVTSGSGLSREKVELAFKLLEVVEYFEYFILDRVVH